MSFFGNNYPRPDWSDTVQSSMLIIKQNRDFRKILYCETKKAHQTCVPTGIINLVRNLFLFNQHWLTILKRKRLENQNSTRNIPGTISMLSGKVLCCFLATYHLVFHLYFAQALCKTEYNCKHVRLFVRLRMRWQVGPSCLPLLEQRQQYKIYFSE